MTISWLKSLMENDELDSDWCRLAEERPVWAMWWFLTAAATLCISLVWVFLPVR